MTTRPVPAFDPFRTAATVPAWTINEADHHRDRFSLASLLVCDGCDQFLQPMILAGGQRGYRAPCGCRLSTIDAAVVERLVRDRVERHCPTSVADVPRGSLGDVFSAVVAAVRIGGSCEDLRLIWRT